IPESRIPYVASLGIGRLRPGDREDGTRHTASCSLAGNNESRGSRQDSFMTAIVSGILVGLVGLALLVGGAWLGALGGSLYYLLAGIGLLVAAGLLVARRRAALWVYAVVLIGTLGWSVLEIGFDWWPLAARGDILFPLGLWLLCPWVTRNLQPAGVADRSATAPLWAGIGLSVIVLAVALFSEKH